MSEGEHKHIECIRVGSEGSSSAGNPEAKENPCSGTPVQVIKRQSH